jgi:hypothetical protein
MQTLYSEIGEHAAGCDVVKCLGVPACRVLILDLLVV